MAKIITSSNLDEFLNSNKDSLIVFIFDAPFTEQSEIVSSAEKAILSSVDLKDKIAIGKIDVEENNDLALKFEVEAVPIVACLYKGNVIKRINYLEPSGLLTMVRESLGKNSMMQAGEELGEQDLKLKFKEYLKQLVNRSPIMIFMKGDPKQPRCGFSKQLIELLTKYSVQYDTFDILLDDDVRQGLKEYSDWPTYPQIYVKGEFIGGLDILKQLDESGELESTLKPQ